jgi:hypothetical protein
LTELPTTCAAIEPKVIDWLALVMVSVAVAVPL